MESMDLLIYTFIVCSVSFMIGIVVGGIRRE
jgi:hypothetical protein